jgi:isocitrate/isopropylmalate dehydrogenase
MRTKHQLGDEEGVYIMKRFINIFKLNKEEKMQNVVDSHQINDIEIKYSMEELLTFYMEQSKSLTEELAKAKADLVLAEKKVEEKDIAIKTLKEALESTEKKVTRLEKRNIRLAAIERVWKETFAKFTLVEGGSVESNDDLTALERQEIEQEIDDSYDFSDMDCVIDYEEL